MHLFGLTFVLYLLKLSAGNGFWKNIRSADEQAYKVAVTFERLNKKLLSAELALRTLLILMTVFFFLFLFCTYFILMCLLMLIYHPFSI